MFNSLQILVSWAATKINFMPVIREAAKMGWGWWSRKTLAVTKLVPNVPHQLTLIVKKVDKSQGVSLCNPAKPSLFPTLAEGMDRQHTLEIKFLAQAWYLSLSPVRLSVAGVAQTIQCNISSLTWHKNPLVARPSVALGNSSSSGKKIEGHRHAQLHSSAWEKFIAPQIQSSSWDSGYSGWRPWLPWFLPAKTWLDGWINENILYIYVYYIYIYYVYVYPIISHN